MSMTQEHTRHPGYDAGGCPLRVTVNAAPTAAHASGFACAYTGGHCLPCHECDARRADDELFRALLAFPNRYDIEKAARSEARTRPDEQREEATHDNS